MNDCEITASLGNPDVDGPTFSTVQSNLYQARFHKPMKTRCCTSAKSIESIQSYRLWSAAILSPIIWVSVLVNGPLYFVKFATQWCAWHTFAAFCLVYKSARVDMALEKLQAGSQDTESLKSGLAKRQDEFQREEELTQAEQHAYKWRKWACIMNQIAIAWQFIICFVFWAVVAPIFIPPANMLWRFGLIVTHTLPLILLVINFYLTDSRLKFGDWWHSFVIAAVYSVANRFFTVYDEPVYPFLDWSPPLKSAIDCFVAWAFGQLCYQVLCYVDAKIKGRQTLSSI